jgi:hypothetical protein
MANLRMLVIMDDCASSMNSWVQNPDLRDLFMYERNYNIMDPYQWERVYNFSKARQARQECRERAIFFRSQLWQRIPVKDVLNIVACFYSSGFDTKTKCCVVIPPQAERMLVYQVLLALAHSTKEIGVV